MVEPESTVEIDLERVHAELALRAGELRAAGGVPLEAEIEAAVNAAVPGRAGDVAGLLQRAEAQAAVEPLPPFGTPRLPFRLAKQAVRRVTVGPLTNLAAQVGALGATLTAASRALEARVAGLEERFGGVGDLPAPPLLPASVVDAVADEIHRRLAPTAGPAGVAMHVGAGDGSLLARFQALGVPGRGYEQDPGLVVAARSAGLDVRLETRPDGPDRLGDDGSVGLVVLGPVVDVLTAAELHRLLLGVHRSLAAGGTLAVTSFDPATFARRQPVLADLAQGRPLRLATWEHLLAAAGFTAPTCVEVEVDDGHLRVLTCGVGVP